MADARETNECDVGRAIVYAIAAVIIAAILFCHLDKRAAFANGYEQRSVETTVGPRWLKATP